METKLFNQLPQMQHFPNTVLNFIYSYHWILFISIIFILGFILFKTETSIKKKHRIIASYIEIIISGLYSLLAVFTLWLAILFMHPGGTGLSYVKQPNVSTKISSLYGISQNNGINNVLQQNVLIQGDTNDRKQHFNVLVIRAFKSNNPHKSLLNMKKINIAVIDKYGIHPKTSMGYAYKKLLKKYVVYHKAHPYAKAIFKVKANQLYMTVYTLSKTQFKLSQSFH